jgi:PEP-CTERM motif-containing protein
MKLRKLALAPIAAAAMAFSLPAMADSWILNFWGGSGGPPPGSDWGTVTATDNGDSLHVEVTLDTPPLLGFVDTGSHHAFTFNIVGIVASVTNLNWGTALPTGTYQNPAFGPFTNAIDNDTTGNNFHLPPLTFDIVANGIGIANLGLNPTFAADVIFEGGLTGTIGNGVPAIPEPETYAMMLAGLGLLGFVARRRRQGLGNVVPA